MKRLTLTRQLLVVIAMMMYALGAHAADEQTTEQTVITVEHAGTLHEKIDSASFSLVTNLKLVGELNGTDILYIRNCADNITILDMEDVTFVWCKDPYYQLAKKKYYTEPNTIGDYMFYGKSSLQQVVLPATVTEIGKQAFGFCSNLVSVSLPSTLQTIGTSAFAQCGSLVSINLPESLTTIDQMAFVSCTSLTSVKLPSGITSIELSTFNNCANLQYVDLPETLTNIGQSAFALCSSLKEIVIPDSVKSVGQMAFMNCTALKTITLSKAMEGVGNWIFYGCTALTAVYIAAETPPTGYNSLTTAVDTNCTLYVPKGTLNDYLLSDWGVFDNISEYSRYSESGNTEYNSGGLVIGGGDTGTTGVDAVEAGGGAVEVARYAADGQQLAAPAKGLNIVRMSDGSIRKVMVR